VIEHPRNVFDARSISQKPVMYDAGMFNGIMHASTALASNQALTAGGDTTPATGSPMIGKSLVLPEMFTHLLPFGNVG